MRKLAALALLALLAVASGACRSSSTPDSTPKTTGTIELPVTNTINDWDLDAIKALHASFVNSGHTDETASCLGRAIVTGVGQAPGHTPEQYARLSGKDLAALIADTLARCR